MSSSRTGAEKQGFTTTIRSRAQNRSRGVDAALDFLAPRINYSSCHDVAQLYSVRLHSGDMAHIRDTAPVICRGFVIFEVRHAKKPQRRAPRRTATPRLRIGRDHTLENADRSPPSCGPVSGDRRWRGAGGSHGHQPRQGAALFPDPVGAHDLTKRLGSANPWGRTAFNRTDNILWQQQGKARSWHRVGNWPQGASAVSRRANR